MAYSSSTRWDSSCRRYARLSKIGLSTEGEERGGSEDVSPGIEALLTSPWSNAMASRETRPDSAPAGLLLYGLTGKRPRGEPVEKRLFVFIMWWFR
jgi:hypothetical protein